MTDRLANIKAQIAVANQVGEDGYWTMKVSDGLWLLDYIQKAMAVVRVARELYDESRERNGPMEGARFGPSLQALRSTTEE